MFDKMSIRQGFCWNPTTNSYMGYETLADPTVVPDRVATSLIVFLLKGLVNGWESVVAYYFTHALSNDTIRSSLGEVLKALKENNIHPSGLAFDGLEANFAAVKTLGASLEPDNMKPYFEYNGEINNVFPDVPHMFKLARNLLCDRKEIYVPRFEAPAKWNFICYLHQYQVGVGLRHFW